MKYILMHTGTRTIHAHSTRTIHAHSILFTDDRDEAMKMLHEFEEGPRGKNESIKLYEAIELSCEKCPDSIPLYSLDAELYGACPDCKKNWFDCDCANEESIQ